MPYRPSVQSSILLQTTSVTAANLGSTLFASANNFFSERVRGYSSFDEVRSDPAIPTESNAYAALRLFFSAPSAAVPVYLGRREVSLSTYTPDPDLAGLVRTYTLTVATGSNSVVASYTSDALDTAEDICTALKTAIDAGSVDITATVVGTGSAAVLTLADSSTDNQVVTGIENLEVSFDTTESAADLLNAIFDEAVEDFYYFTCEDKTQSFILDMAAEIQATASSDYPKQYHVSVAEEDSLVALPDPAVDTLGKLLEFGYDRTAGRWHDDAETLFPEVFAPAYLGRFEPLQGRNWKFIIPNGIPAAADLVTGKQLTTAQQGYIADRNASWYGVERGVTFNHGGKMASGNWIDNILLGDRINDLVETNLLSLLLNSPTGSVKMDTAGKARVAAVIDGILTRAVNAGGLVGYEPTQVPDTVPFADQADRILQDVTFTGYLNANINFIVVNGVLTYQDETLN